MSIVELIEGLGAGVLVREVAHYIHVLAIRKKKAKERSERPELGGLSWLWKELVREKGQWRGLESEIGRLSERIAKLEGKEEGSAPLSARGKR